MARVRREPPEVELVVAFKYEESEPGGRNMGRAYALIPRELGEVEYTGHSKRTWVVETGDMYPTRDAALKALYRRDLEKPTPLESGATYRIEDCVPGGVTTRPDRIEVATARGLITIHLIHK